MAKRASRPSFQTPPKAARSHRASGRGKGLSAKRRQRFVAEYLKDLNATQAYIRAGYSQNGAAQGAERLLRNVEVAAAVAEGQKALAEKAGVTVEKIVGELAKIGFADIRKIVAWQANVTAMVEDPDTGESRMAVTNEVALVGSREIDDATAGAIAEISQTDRGGLKIKLHDKRAALVDLGKHLGMFVEKHEHTASVEMLALLEAGRKRAADVRGS